MKKTRKLFTIYYRIHSTILLIIIINLSLIMLGIGGISLPGWAGIVLMLILVVEHTIETNYLFLVAKKELKEISPSTYIGIELYIAITANTFTDIKEIKWMTKHKCVRTAIFFLEQVLIMAVLFWSSILFRTET